jgi:hypothetical protein
MKSKLIRILKDLRAQSELIYGRRFATQSPPLDLMHLAKETSPRFYKADRRDPLSGEAGAVFLREDGNQVCNPRSR